MDMPTKGHVTGGDMWHDNPVQVLIVSFILKEQSIQADKTSTILRLRTLIWDLSSMCVNLLPLICKRNDSHAGRLRWSWQVLFPQHESLARFASQQGYPPSSSVSNHIILLAKTTKLIQADKIGTVLRLQGFELEILQAYLFLSFLFPNSQAITRTWPLVSDEPSKFEKLPVEDDDSGKIINLFTGI